jgi:hypothetical protein
VSSLHVREICGGSPTGGASHRLDGPADPGPGAEHRSTADGGTAAVEVRVMPLMYRLYEYGLRSAGLNSKTKASWRRSGA